MEFNIFGLIFVVAIMIPNIIFAIKYRDGFENKWRNKLAETIKFFFSLISNPQQLQQSDHLCQK